MSHDDDDYRPRRRREDDFDDDRGERRRSDDDDYGRGRRDGDPVSRARGKILVPAIIMMIIGVLSIGSGVYNVVVRSSNPEEQTKQYYEAFKQFFVGFNQAQQEQQKNKEQPKVVVKGQDVPNPKDKKDLQDKKGGFEEGNEKDDPKEAKEKNQKNDNGKADQPPAPNNNPNVMPYEEFKKAFERWFLFATIFQFFHGGVLLLGGFLMQRLTSYGFSIFSSLVALVPCICCCVPMPVGIWALIVLLNQDVKTGFRMARR